MAITFLGYLDEPEELRELGSLAAQVQEREEGQESIREEIEEPEITVKSAPVLRSGSGSADNVTFLGYIDEPEELLSGKRRCLFGVASSDDVAYLPTDDGLTLPSGGKTAKPADWSLALVPGGDAQVLIGGSWGAL